MKSLALVLCFCAAATLAAPQNEGCRTAKKIKYVEEFENQCHSELR